MEMPPSDSSGKNNQNTNIAMLDLLLDNRRMRIMPSSPDVKQIAADLIREHVRESSRAFT